VPLLVCRTCPRDARDSGSFGADLDRAVDALARRRGVRVRHVPCLGGCPRPGNAGLDAMGKPRVRFSAIDPAEADDAAALVEAAARYDASPSGMPGDWLVPEPLRGRLTSVTPKRVG
jgi:predicted metal-binding protein